MLTTVAGVFKMSIVIEVKTLCSHFPLEWFDIDKGVSGQRMDDLMKRRRNEEKSRSVDNTTTLCG